MFPTSRKESFNQWKLKSDTLELKNKRENKAHNGASGSNKKREKARTILDDENFYAIFSANFMLRHSWCAYRAPNTLD